MNKKATGDVIRKYSYEIKQVKIDSTTTKTTIAED